MCKYFKCRKCRQVIVNLQETSVFDFHNHVVKQLSNFVLYDCGSKLVDVWYMCENNAPDWALKCVNNGSWQKGKLCCPHCNARIGSFDFISGFKCSCDEELLPPMRLVKSKVDLCL